MIFVHRIETILIRHCTKKQRFFRLFRKNAYICNRTKTNNTVKKQLFFFVLLGFASISLFAQSEDTTLNNLDFEEIAPEKETRPPYFAIGGGYTISFWFPTYTDIQSKASEFGFTKEFSSPLLVNGFQFFSGVGFIENLRAGIYSNGGASTISRTLGGDSGTAEMQYQVGSTGITLDYAIVPTKGLAILPGVAVGLGSVNIQHRTSPKDVTWPNFQPSTSSAQTIGATAIYLQPNLNIEYSFTSFSMIRLNAGYNLTFLQDFKNNGLGVVSGVPSGINGNALTGSLGIFIGLFN